MRKRESVLMAMEENAKARETYRFMDLDSEQERESNAAISVSVARGYEVVQSRRFERVNRATLNAATAVWKDKMRVRAATYDGPPAGQLKSIEFVLFPAAVLYFALNCFSMLHFFYSYTLSRLTISTQRYKVDTPVHYTAHFMNFDV